MKKSSNLSAPIDAETLGLAYGFLGVLVFSLTLPATRLAVAEIDSNFVGLGRALVASFKI